MSRGIYFGFKIFLLSESDCSNKNSLKHIFETSDSSHMILNWILIGIKWTLKIVSQRIIILLYQCFHQSKHFNRLRKQPYNSCNKVTLNPAINYLMILIMLTPSTKILFASLEKNIRNSFRFKSQLTNSKISKIYWWIFIKKKS